MKAFLFYFNFFVCWYYKAYQHAFFTIQMERQKRTRITVDSIPTVLCSKLVENLH